MTLVQDKNMYFTSIRTKETCPYYVNGKMIHENDYSFHIFIYLIGFLVIAVTVPCQDYFSTKVILSFPPFFIAVFISLSAQSEINLLRSIDLISLSEIMSESPSEQISSRQLSDIILYESA